MTRAKRLGVFALAGSAVPIAASGRQVTPNPVDSMGSGGDVDTSWVPPQRNINTCFDQVFYKQQDIAQPPDQAAQIVSVEIANNPSPGPSISPCP